MSHRLSLASDPGIAQPTFISPVALEAFSPMAQEPSTVIQSRRTSNLGSALAGLQSAISTIKPTTHAPLQSTKLDNYISDASSPSSDPETPLTRRLTELERGEEALGRLSLGRGGENENSRFSVNRLSIGEDKPRLSAPETEQSNRFSLGETSRLSLGDGSNRLSLGDQNSRLSLAPPRLVEGSRLGDTGEAPRFNESHQPAASLVNEVRLSIANELDNARLSGSRPQESAGPEVSPSVRIANTLRRLDAELARSKEGAPRPRAISAEAPSTTATTNASTSSTATATLESLRQLRQENELRRQPPVALAPPTLGPSNATMPASQVIKAMMQEALDDVAASLRNDLQNMHIELIRQSMAQRQLMESLLASHATPNEASLQAELQRLRTENEHLRQLLRQ